MEKSCSISDLIDTARKHNPNHIVLKGADALNSELSDFLEKMPNFQFEVRDGFFRWSYGGIEEGVFGENIQSERFFKFERWVVREQPQTFEDIEGAL